MKFFWLLGFLAGSAGAQGLVNGGFEAPSLGYTFNLAGPFVLPGWEGVGPSDGGNAGVVMSWHTPLAAFEGAQHFTFNGGNPSDRGWIEQAFVTVPGEIYRVEFALGRVGGGQELGVRVDVGGVSGVFSPPGTVGYTVASVEFVAGEGLSRLRFTDVSGPNSISDLYLDAVRVSAVPEPSMWASLAGLAGLGMALWRRRR